MTDTERINWIEEKQCAVGQHVSGQWRIITNASGGPGSLVGGGQRVSVGDTLRDAIDAGIKAGEPTTPQ